MKRFFDQRNLRGEGSCRTGVAMCLVMILIGVGLPNRIDGDDKVIDRNELLRSLVDASAEYSTELPSADELAKGNERPSFRRFQIGDTSGRVSLAEFMTQVVALRFGEYPPQEFGWRSDDGRQMVMAFPSLRYLEVKGKTWYRILEPRFSEMGELRHLRLTTRGHGAELISSLTPLKRLLTLEIWDASLDDESLSPLRELKRLRRLVLAPMIHPSSRAAKQRPIRAETLFGLAGGMPDLQYLETVRCALPGVPDWEALATLKQLNTLKFRWTSLNDEQFRGIRALDQVEKLELLHTPITDVSLHEIAAMESLQVLALNHTDVKRGILALAKSSSLRSLSASDSITSGEELTQEMVEYLAKVSPGQFSLGKVDPNVAALEELNRILGEITEVNVNTDSPWMLVTYRTDAATQRSRGWDRASLNRSMTARDREDLRKLTGLRRLIVRGRGIVDHSLTKHLRQHPRLERIEFDRAKIDAPFMEALSSCPKLEEIEIEHADVVGNVFGSFAGSSSIKSVVFGELHFD
ncbi:MAG: hypothetical protein AAF989_16645, partial [Planctomycetota bacterium]